MKIAIGPLHDAKINQALLHVNGKACDHTFTQGAQVWELSKLAENRLENLGLLKKHRQGARFEAISGEPVPNKYKYSRIATKIILERGANEWFLVSVSRGTIYAAGGYKIMRLLDEQHVALILATVSKANAKIL